MKVELRLSTTRAHSASRITETERDADGVSIPDQEKECLLLFTSFATELGYDFIDVRDTVYPTNLIGRFSGSQIPPIVVSCGSSVTVTFNSDSIISDYGFLAFLSPTVRNGHLVSG